MALFHYNSPALLEALVKKLTNEGKSSDRFENFGIHNISKWICEGNSLKDFMKIYGYPAENPLYIFIIDQKDGHFAEVQVRTPTEGHDGKLLAEGLKLIYQLVSIHPKGELCLAGDTGVRDAFFKLQETGELQCTTEFSEEYPVFYMNERQRKELTEMELVLPAGFKTDTVNVDKEYEKMHNAWRYADISPAEVSRFRLANLPYACIRDLDGNLASWEMTDYFGQLSHLYTFERYRGQGIGLLTELLLAQNFAKSGLHVYKYMAQDNVKVLSGTRKSPFWCLWKTEGGEARMWTFNTFVPKKSQ